MKYLLLLFIITFNAMGADFLPKSFSGDFEQIKTSIISGKQIKTTGTIDYKYPSSIRLEMLSPEKLYLVSNSKKTWYYRPSFIEGEKGELTVKDTGTTELSTFFDILKYGIKKNKFYSARAHNGKLTMNLTEFGVKRTNIKKATIHYVGQVKFENIKKIIIKPTEASSFSLSFTKMKVNVPFKKEHFVFKVP